MDAAKINQKFPVKIKIQQKNRQVFSCKNTSNRQTTKNQIEITCDSPLK